LLAVLETVTNFALTSKLPNLQTQRLDRVLLFQCYIISKIRLKLTYEEFYATFLVVGN
jgi:hypothetical protein